MPKLRPLNPEKDRLIKTMKIALVEKGWTQDHLAEICASTPSQISRVINNPDKCHFSTLCLVAKKLGIKELPVI